MQDKYIIKNIDIVKDEYKLEKQIREGNIGEWSKDNKGNIYLIVKFHKDISLEVGVKELKKYDINVINKIESINALTILIPENKLEKLYDIKLIASIRELESNNELKLESSKGIVGVNYLYSTYDLTGENVKIMMYENTPTEHQDFVDRLYVPERTCIPLIGCYGVTYDNHSTFVAGILIGNGSVNSSYRGIAPKATLYSYQIHDTAYNRTGDLDDDYEDAIEDSEVRVASNSWGIIVNSSTYYQLGDYTDVSEMLDSIIRGYYDKEIPIVWANGNERGHGFGTYGTVLPKASAKNVISVGNVEDDYSIYWESSYGPTDDGRIKPEIVAPGCINSTRGESDYTSGCGTSASAPHVSGTIALMLEQWDSQYSNDPLPSTIKAMLLDSATDLENDGLGDQVIDGPDYINGFGLLNAKEAVDRIRDETFIESNLTNSNDVDVYAINVSGAQSELKVTLAWDDVPGANLINDLDIKLISPLGQTFYPWTLNPSSPSSNATRNNIANLKDHTNVVEQVYAKSTDSGYSEGEWLVIVSVTNGSNYDLPQKYSIVSENKIGTPSPVNTTIGLVGFWKGENDVLDYSGRDNHGTKGTGVSFTTGKFGDAFDLSGTSGTSYLNLPIGTKIKTISFWIKFDVGSVTKYIVTNSAGQGSASVINWQNDNTIDGRVGNGAYKFDAFGTISTDEWYHMTFVSTSSGERYYLNGQYVGTQSGSQNTLNETSLYFGRHPTPGYEVDGKLDEINIWDVELTDNEIYQIYSGGLEEYTPEEPTYTPVEADSYLIGHWQGENNVDDSSSNNNDGTKGNSVSYTTGINGSAFDLSGTSGTSYLNLPIGDTIKTISFWIKFDVGSVTKYIVTNSASQSSASVINWQNDNTIDGRVGNGAYKFDAFGVIDTNRWYHMTFVSTSAGERYYLNGQYFGTQSGNENTLSETSLYFGRHPTPGYEVDGKLDEINIWGRSLSDSEVERLYYAGITYD